MTQNQINWAKSHDWYLTASAVDGAVWVIERWTHEGQTYSRARQFHNFKQLRKWAGY